MGVTTKWHFTKNGKEIEEPTLTFEFTETKIQRFTSEELGISSPVQEVVDRPVDEWYIDHSTNPPTLKSR